MLQINTADWQSRATTLPDLRAQLTLPHCIPTRADVGLGEPARSVEPSIATVYLPPTSGGHQRYRQEPRLRSSCRQSS